MTLNKELWFLTFTHIWYHIYLNYLIYIWTYIIHTLYTGYMTAQQTWRSYSKLSTEKWISLKNVKERLWEKESRMLQFAVNLIEFAKC